MNSIQFPGIRAVPRRGWGNCLLAALLLAGCAARADLKWDATRLEFHPSVTDKEVKAEFSFTNEGSAPVSIDAVEPGCGCTTAGLDKRTYQPGEQGIVRATFHIGDRTGFQSKVICVRIHGSHEPVVLTMATYIPELMKIEPRYVFWRLGEPPVPRRIKLTVAPEARLSRLHVISTSPKFKAALEPLREGSTYMLVVTPTDTSADVSAEFNIDALAAAGNPNGPFTPKRFQAYANIIPK